MKQTPKKKILVVDDEPHIVNLIKILLQDRYEIIEAYSSLVAMKKAIEEKPDLITLDVMMPNMDGFELCDRLKANPMTRNIPIIMVTAKTRMKDKIEGIEVGADDYITKPFDPIELEQKIKVVLHA